LTYPPGVKARNYACAVTCFLSDRCKVCLPEDSLFISAMARIIFVLVLLVTAAARELQQVPSLEVVEPAPPKHVQVAPVAVVPASGSVVEPLAAGSETAVATAAPDTTAPPELTLPTASPEDVTPVDAAASTSRIRPATVSTTYLKWVSNRQRRTATMAYENMNCGDACTFAYWSYPAGTTTSWTAVNGGGSSYLCKVNQFAGSAGLYNGGPGCYYRYSDGGLYVQPNTGFSCACIYLYPNGATATAIWVTDGRPAIANNNYRICKFNSESTYLMGYVKDNYCLTQQERLGGKWASCHPVCGTHHLMRWWVPL